MVAGRGQADVESTASTVSWDPLVGFHEGPGFVALDDERFPRPGSDRGRGTDLEARFDPRPGGAHQNLQQSRVSASSLSMLRRTLPRINDRDSRDQLAQGRGSRGQA